MPTKPGTRFRYRPLPKKEGIERRQRLTFAPRTNKVIETKTEEQRNSKWVEVKGNSRARGSIRRSL